MTAEYIESPLLARAGFRHAFFTRRGGHAPLPFDSLHFGKIGQTAEQLAANVGAAARVLGVDPRRLFTATQVHGRDVVAVQRDDDAADCRHRQADALVTSVADTACGVKVADCVPILIADSASGAVAAIHSGWQGTEIDVVDAAVAKLRTELGARGRLLAAIGPHIEACCFEVGDDVADRLQRCAPVGTHVVSRANGPRPHVDLRAIVRAQLVRLGLEKEDIDDVRGCTKCDAVRYFSFRRDREQSGRLLAAITVRS